MSLLDHAKTKNAAKRELLNRAFALLKRAQELLLAARTRHEAASENDKLKQELENHNESTRSRKD